MACCLEFPPRWRSRRNLTEDDQTNLALYEEAKDRFQKAIANARGDNTIMCGYLCCLCTLGCSYCYAAIATTSRADLELYATRVDTPGTVENDLKVLLTIFAEHAALIKEHSDPPCNETAWYAEKCGLLQRI